MWGCLEVLVFSQGILLNLRQFSSLCQIFNRNHLTFDMCVCILEIRAFMAESQTFYVSYAPAMEILQHRGITTYS